MTQISLIPVSQLESDFQVGKTVLAERRKALGIQPIKEGRNSYITKADYDLLQELNEWVRLGRTTPDFLQHKGLDKDSGSIRLHQPEISAAPLPDTSALVWSAISHAIQDRFSIQLLPSPDPLANYRLLEEVAEKGWTLPTSKLLALLGLKTNPRLECRETRKFFRRRGFRFERQPKTGVESEWRVFKVCI